MSGNLKKRTLFGYTNHRFHCGDPAGLVTWFLTRKDREAKRAQMVEAATRAGLSDPEGAFNRVLKRLNRDHGELRHAQFAMLIALIEHAGRDQGYTKSLKED